MTYHETLSKLSSTIEHFNNALNETNKLNTKALKTIQDYLNNPEVRILDQNDEEKIQYPLKQLELLNNPVTITRAKSTNMKPINRQLIRLAESLTKKFEGTKKDAYFIVVKLEVCFLDILSEEEINSNKQFQKLYEETRTSSQSSRSSYAKPDPHALRMDRQQLIINELMNVVLYDVILYFGNKGQVFTDHFTDEFLDSLETMTQNPNHSIKDERSSDVLKILMKTAETCQIPIDILISHLRYAMIGFGERTNRFTILLQNYIRNTESPSLMEFNQTIDSSSALSVEEVNQFAPLFDLYCTLFLNSNQDVSQTVSLEASDESTRTLIPSKESNTLEQVPQLNIVTVASSQLHAKERQAQFPTTTKPVHIPTGEQPSLALPLPPPSTSKLESETDLKFIWIEPNIEDYYEDFCTTIHPRCAIPCKASELLPQIHNEWIGSRIFLCVSAVQAYNLLPNIHNRTELYAVYILCQNKTEEDKFRTDNKQFNKLRIVTSNRQEFIRQLSIDIIPSLIEVGDTYLETQEYDNAIRWYNSALEKVNNYGGATKNWYLPTINKKIEQCLKD